MNISTPFFNMNPAKLAGLDAKAAYGFLVEMVRHYSARGIAGSTVKSYVKAVRSWLTHSDIEINADKKVKIRGRREDSDAG